MTAPRKSKRTTGTAGKPRKKLALQKDTIKDLAPGAQRGRAVRGGMFTLSCPGSSPGAGRKIISTSLSSGMKGGGATINSC